MKKDVIDVQDAWAEIIDCLGNTSKKGGQRFHFSEGNFQFAGGISIDVPHSKALSCDNIYRLLLKKIVKYQGIDLVFFLQIRQIRPELPAFNYFGWVLWKGIIVTVDSRDNAAKLFYDIEKTLQVGLEQLFYSFNEMRFFEQQMSKSKKRLDQISVHFSPDKSVFLPFR